MRSVNFRPRINRCVFIFITVLLTVTCIFIISERIYPDNFIKSRYSSAVASYLKTGLQCSFNGKSEESIPELPVGKARYDNNRMVKTFKRNI